MPGLQGQLAGWVYLMLGIASVAGFLFGLWLVSRHNILPGTEEFSAPVRFILSILGLALAGLLALFSIFVGTTPVWPFGVFGIAIAMSAIAFLGTWSFRTRDW